jgi:hypothetical protein
MVFHSRGGQGGASLGILSSDCAFPAFVSLPPARTAVFSERYSLDGCSDPVCRPRRCKGRSRDCPAEEIADDQEIDRLDKTGRGPQRRKAAPDGYCREFHGLESPERAPRFSGIRLDLPDLRRGSLNARDASASPDFGCNERFPRTDDERRHALCILVHLRSGPSSWSRSPLPCSCSSSTASQALRSSLGLRRERPGARRGNGSPGNRCSASRTAE